MVRVLRIRDNFSEVDTYMMAVFENQRTNYKNVSFPVGNMFFSRLNTLMYCALEVFLLCYLVNDVRKRPQGRGLGLFSIKGQNEHSLAESPALQ